MSECLLLVFHRIFFMLVDVPFKSGLKLVSRYRAIVIRRSVCEFLNQVGR